MHAAPDAYQNKFCFLIDYQIVFCLAKIYFYLLNNFFFVGDINLKSRLLSRNCKYCFKCFKLQPS